MVIQGGMTVILDRRQYHPDKMLGRSGEWYTWCHNKWWGIVKANDLSTIRGFRWALNQYCDDLGTFRQKLHAEIRKIENHENLSPQELYSKYLTVPTLAKAVKISLAQYQVVVDWVVDTYRLSDYGKLHTHPFLREIIERETVDCGFQDLKSEYVLRHAIKVYRDNGERMYFVSPGLEHELRNTSVRGMPEEFLRLPYQSIYLVCPVNERFRIFHDEDGWHDVEGVYLVEDHSSIPRTIRIVVTGLPNAGAKFDEDDAFYHWLLYLEEGKTIDECIERSFDVGRGKNPMVRKVEGSDIEIISGHGQDQGDVDVFVKNQKQLRAIFNYAMNVLLYVMHPDAEMRRFNTSADYDALRDRAMKARGKKRSSLFTRAKQARGKDRVLLGGSIVVSRKPTVPTQNPGTGTKHRVRTYVQGHWQTYWTGPRDGERTRVYRHKRPYWKGLKDGPLSSKAHVLK